MKYAESILDIGRLPLRRRDRAAMVFAVEMLRQKGTPSFMWDEPRGVVREISRAFVRSFQGGMDDEAIALHYARLFLLLRCLLRVDAGDYGARERWLQCDRCFRVERDLESLAAAQGVCVPYPRNGAEGCAPGSHAPGLLSPMRWPLPPIRPVRPLWQDAPGGQR